MPKPLLEAKLTLIGEKDLERVLKELPRRAVKKVLRQAVTAGAAPIVKDTRKRAKAIKQTGLTAKAVNRVVRTYPSGVAVAIIGVNKAVGGRVREPGRHFPRNRIPAFYWHLINGGVEPHAIGSGSSLRRNKQSGRMHPGFKGRQILADAVDATATKSREASEAKMKQALLKEAAKVAAK